MPIIDEARREFVARVVADLGKTLFGIGLASYFFEQFPLALRLTLGMACLIALLGSVFIQPRKRGGNKG